jgi:hypothetical protein
LSTGKKTVAFGHGQNSCPGIAKANLAFRKAKLAFAKVKLAFAGVKLAFSRVKAIT